MTADEFIAIKEEKFKKESWIRVKDITRERNHTWIREAWTFMPQSDYPEKVFVIERLRNKDKLEYRFGYYIVSKYGRTRGRWVWGQFCPFIPAKDFKMLIGKAQSEGTIL